MRVWRYVLVNASSCRGIHRTADSYYEYLIKEYQLLAGGVDQYSRMYAEAVDTAIDHLVAEVEVIPGESLLTIGTSSWHTFEPDLEHLVSAHRSAKVLS